MGQTQGYPAEADIISFLSDIGIELVSENNANFMQEYRQAIWGILSAAHPALILSVYPASSSTFNVRGGRYIWDGAVKTFTPGAAIDPVDNDTTYVWMKSDNTIGYDIDGNGWPLAGTQHLKLAEIDVDADGNITDVREMRAPEFHRDV